MKPLYDSSKFDTAQGIFYDPWVLTLDILFTITLIVDLLVGFGTLSAIDWLSGLLIAGAVGRMIYLYRRRRTYDFSRSRRFYDRLGALSEWADGIYCIVLLVAYFIFRLLYLRGFFDF